MVRLLALLGVVIHVGVTTAQVERFDVGRKLIAFEKAWDGQTDATARKRTLPPMKRALQSFFGGRLTDAGKAVDEARMLLASDPPASESQRWANSLVIRPEYRLIDPTATKLIVRIQELYASGVRVPHNASVTLQLTASAGRSTTGPVTVPIQSLPANVTIPISVDNRGDQWLRGYVAVDGKTLVHHDGEVAIVDNLALRLEAIESASQMAGKAPPSMESLTLRSHVTVIQSLSNGGTWETAYPASRLIDEAAAIAKQGADKPYFDASKPGQFWLSIPTTNGGSAGIRVQIPPQAAAGKPLPIVVALHGMGGSENMFFDTYGHGEVARQCASRGWILVATRTEGFFASPPVIAVIDELAKRYPIDPKKVFLVGHSMGAGQIVGLARSSPERFAGVACLGGGGRVLPSEKIKSLPFFVGCGTEDFALGGARALVSSLREAGVTKVKSQEYPDIEHIVIVQVALPDVFKWYDELLKP